MSCALEGLRIPGVGLALVPGSGCPGRGAHMDLDVHACALHVHLCAESLPTAARKLSGKLGQWGGSLPPPTVLAPGGGFYIGAWCLGPACSPRTCASHDSAPTPACLPGWRGVRGAGRYPGIIKIILS